MKNLLIKTLFISLLLSAAMPSGVRAGILTRNLEKAAIIAAITALAASKGEAGVRKGVGIAAVMGGAIGTVGLIRAGVKKVGGNAEAAILVTASGAVGAVVGTAILLPGAGGAIAGVAIIVSGAVADFYE